MRIAIYYHDTVGLFDGACQTLQYRCPSVYSTVNPNLLNPLVKRARAFSPSFCHRFRKQIAGPGQLINASRWQVRAMINEVDFFFKKKPQTTDAEIGIDRVRWTKRNPRIEQLSSIRWAAMGPGEANQASLSLPASSQSLPSFFASRLRRFLWTCRNATPNMFTLVERREKEREIKRE